ERRDRGGRRRPHGGGRRGAARAAAARRPRDRPPVPLRQPRRRRDRAAAGGRDAVPDHLLPHLPAGGVPRRVARGLGDDDLDDRAAGRRPHARSGVHPRPRAVPRGPRRHRRGAGGRRGLRRRHADAGQVPARPRRPVPRPGAWRQPARRRGARAARAVVGGRPLRARARAGGGGSGV
ncbi:MAG: FIG004853: possible toxin to DivIC, partial [uncultured Nocardioidaceae bacterium]